MLLFSRVAQDPEAPPLVGRHDELRDAVGALQLRDVRLLTVTGPAGVGKTRFAAEVASRLESHFADGLIAIDLANLTDADDLEPEIARSLGLIVPDYGAIREQIGAYLAGKQILLLLDNAEHVLPVGSCLVEWLAISPGSRALVTSRHLLNLSMEVELNLAPLPVRRPVQAGGNGASEYASVAAELFLQLKADVIGNERPDAITLDLIEQVCLRCGGLPLAIELVAARIASLSESSLREFLSDTGLPDSVTQRDVDQALYLAVEWSYRLLSPGAQNLFRYLTVFVEGFSLELVERLVSHTGQLTMPAGETFDCLLELSDHHLILAAPDAEIDTPRFHMLDMVAESGRRMLIERGEEADARRAQARAMIDYAEHREYSGLRPKQEYQNIELEVNYHNLLAALTWLRDEEDGAALQRLVGALTWFWYSLGHYRVAQSWFETVIERGEVGEGPYAARLLAGYAVILDIQGKFTAAMAPLRDAYDWFAAADHELGMSYTSLALGFCSIHVGNNDEAETHLHRALDHTTRVQDGVLARTVEGLAWANIGANDHERGRLDEAEAALRRAVDIHRQSGVLWGECRTLCDLGDLDRDRGRLLLAMSSYQAVIAPAIRLGDRRLVAASLAGIATVLAHDGQATTSAWLWGAVDALLPVVGQPSYLQCDLHAFKIGRMLARRIVGGRHYDKVRRDGEQAPLDDVLEMVGTLQLRLDEKLEVPESIAKGLTDRERDVLQYLVVGASNKAIGTALDITDRTVSSHIASIFRKLGVNSRLEVVSAVVRSQ